MNMLPRRPETDGRPADQGDRERDGIHVVREAVPARRPVVDVEELHRERERPSILPRFGALIRVLFGMIWLIDAYFKWQPSFQHGLLGVMHDGAEGQPGFLMPWFNLNHAIIALQPTLWAYGIALVESGIALALLVGVVRKVTYVGGAVWSLFIWTTAEGFGRAPSGAVATDIGTAIIYTMVFLALLAADQCAGTRAYSLDAVIEARVPWWRRVAEVRR